MPWAYDRVREDLPMRLLLTLAAGGALLAGAAVAQPAGEGVYVPAAKIAASVATTKDGLATAPVAAGPGTTVLAAHRDADGQVEVHARLNDEFVVLSGHATVLVGGKVEGNMQTAPGEWRGGKISGAKAYAMGPGDVLWIPAGAPHQSLVPKGGDFRYLAFKFEAKP
jgi:mannose-6-phosphate isomerase-like protein (cupin superfamily)